MQLPSDLSSSMYYYSSIKTSISRKPIWVVQLQRKRENNNYRKSGKNRKPQKSLITSRCMLERLKGRKEEPIGAERIWGNWRWLAVIDRSSKQTEQWPWFLVSEATSNYLNAIRLNSIKSQFRAWPKKSEDGWKADLCGLSQEYRGRRKGRMGKSWKFLSHFRSLISRHPAIYLASCLSLSPTT